MPVTKDIIRKWFNEGLTQSATHMIIVCDTYDHSDFPIYVMPGENTREKATKEGEKPMQRVMEVYSLLLPVEEQYKQTRVFNYD